MSEEDWELVGAKTKRRPTVDHKILEKQFHAYGLAKLLSSPEAFTLRVQGFKFFTVVNSRPQDSKDADCEKTYLALNNREGQYAGFIKF